MCCAFLGCQSQRITTVKSDWPSQQKEEKKSPTESRAGRPVPGYSYTATGEKVSDEQIKEWLLELLEGEEFVYGYKFLAQSLRDKYDLIFNKKKSYRLCQELGILQKPKERVRTHPRRLPRNRVIMGRPTLANGY